MNNFTQNVFTSSKNSFKKMVALCSFLLVFFSSSSVFSQSYLGLDGGFEGSATIDNTTTYTVGQSGKWSKSNATQTLANETSVVRSGGNALRINNSSTTGRRIYTPTFTTTTGQRLVIQYYRRAASTTNTQQTQSMISFTGVTNAESTVGSYTAVTTANTWEKVTYFPTATTSATTLWGGLLNRQTGSGGDMFIDDVVIYVATAVDNTAPNSSGAITFSGQTTSTINLSWGAASGGVDNGGYIVVRGTVDPTAAPNVNGIYATSNALGSGTIVYSGTGTSFTDTGLSASTTYFYRVYTFDKAYNYSSATTGSSATISSAITSIASGNWSSTSTWSGGVIPTSADNAVIASSHVVVMNSGTYATRNAGTTTTVDAGGTLATSQTYVNNGTTTVNGSFRLDNGGWVSDAGGTNALVYGTNGTLIFNTSGSYGVNNGNYWPSTSGPVNVTINSGGINLGFSRTVTGTFQTAAGVTLSSSTLTLNGICQLNSGGFFNNSPTYGTASTLVYNTSYGVYNEWTGNGAAGIGIPANVRVQSGTLTLTTSNRGIPGNMTIDSTCSLVLNGTSGDLYIGGNWNNSGTFTPNGRAVFFNGAANQTITNASGETFNYLINNKSAGNLILANNVTVNASSGSPLQILNAGAIDLNGKTLTLSNNGGNIQVTGAARSITSTVAGGIVSITGTKTVTSTSSGTLTLGTNVTTSLKNGINFGASLTTIEGKLQVNVGGYVISNAPIYAATSTLEYNSVTGYGVNNEWTGNATTAGVGTPQNVTLTNSSVNLPNAVRSLAGNLTIGASSTLNMNGAAGADMNIGGNWNNAGTFNPNNRLVIFRGASAQSLTGATTFDYLKMDNSAGLTLNNSITNTLTLDLTSGNITLGTNNLTIGSAGTVINASATSYVRTNSTGQFKRTVGASATLFPTGNSAYNPITFNNSGTSDVYGVRVEDGALTTALVNTKTINRKWITTELVVGGSNLSVVAQYNTGEPNTGYDAGTNPYIGFYNGSVWSQVAATLSGSDPYTAASTANSTPADLTSGTQYFAVGKDNAFESDATHLVFVNVPLTGNVSVNLVAFTVEALRSDDSLDTTFTGSVTITKASGPGNLGGTLSIPAVNGVATFNAAQFNAIGTYTLQATSGSLTHATSGNIVISEILAAWDFNGVGSTSLPTYAATTFNSGLSTTSGANNITRGADAAWSTASNSFRTQGFKNEGIATSNTDYFQTTLIVKAGYEMSLYSIDARFAGTASYCVAPGVSNQFAYSLDGTNFTLIGSPIMIIGTPKTLPQIDISAISALQNLPADTTVTFRYYASGQTTTGGWGFNSPDSGTNGLAYSGEMICIQPTAYTVSGGGAICDDASTTIVLSDSEIGMNYQLKKDGVDEGAPIAGTGAALSFTGINQAETYTIVATNAYCSASTTMTGSAVVTITPDTSITTHPVSQEVCVGESVTFTVVAANSSAYSYEWKKNGVTVGTDSDTFTIVSTVAGDAGNYTVDVLGDCGAVVTSNVATLSFPYITWCNLESPSNGSNVLVMGQDYTIQSQVYLECVTDGSGDASPMSVWIGYNTADTDPSTWTNWVQVTAPYADLGNNFRYSMSSRDLLPSGTGTYYIASRYQYNGGSYKYGGYSSGGGHFWDGITYVNGKLEVQPISINGTSVGAWSTFVDMYSTDGVNFSTTIDLIAGELKFVRNEDYLSNDDWGFAGGSNTFYNGTATLNGGNNFTCTTAGTYLVTLNIDTNVYSFTNINCTSSITTTWNGLVWSDGNPDMTKKAVFDGDYNTSAGSISACECQVNATKTITVADDTYFTVARKITNNGTIVVKNQGNVIQYTDETNDGSGSYQVEKQLSAATAYDYVYVSSPVSNEKVGGFGSTFENNPNYKWKYDTTKYLDIASGTYVAGTQVGVGSDGYDDNGNDWIRLLDNTNTVMDEGVGYIVMVDGPDTFNPANIGTPVASQLVNFNDGVFNNGLVSIPVQYDLFPGIDVTNKNNNLNFIGNPYPSAISADRFLAANPGISTPLYFWTHKTSVSGSTPGPDAYNFTNADFATYTLSGGVASANGGAVPTGNIASCQGFMVGVTDLALTNFTFNNLMRLAVNNNNFYKLNVVEDEKDRIWLKLTKDTDFYRQILVAFLPEATLGDDNLYDGVRMFDATTSDFYSYANDIRYAIQALPSFDESYQLPLGMQLIQDGTYQIGLDNFEGIFSQGQAIYLEDTYQDVIHDLGTGAYTFSQTAGVNINDRFILRFTNSALGNEGTNLSQVKVYPNPSTGVFYINYAGSEKLTYTVYDLTGKKVLTGTGTVMDLSTLNSGIYTAQISNAASVKSVKLIRE